MISFKFFKHRYFKTSAPRNIKQRFHSIETPSTIILYSISKQCKLFNQKWKTEFPTDLGVTLLLYLFSILNLCYSTHLTIYKNKKQKRIKNKRIKNSKKNSLLQYTRENNKIFQSCTMNICHRSVYVCLCVGSKSSPLFSIRKHDRTQIK